MAKDEFKTVQQKIDEANARIGRVLAPKSAPIRQEAPPPVRTEWNEVTESATADPTPTAMYVEKQDWTQDPYAMKGKAQPQPFRVTAEMSRGMTPEELAASERYERLSRAYRHLEAEQTFRANLVSEEGLRQLEWLEKRDAGSAQRLIDEAIPKFRRAQEDLDYDIDMARKLQVNPYNYMQSIGRSGRVAAVIASGVNQLAVGAGNPNNVLARLENSINRDIAAQKENIAQTWRGINEKETKTQADMDFIEQQFAWEDKAKAVAYSAVSARIGAAMQHAQTEMSFAALQMVKAEADARAAVHAAEARRKDGVIQFDGKTAVAAEAIRMLDLANSVKQRISLASGQPIPEVGPDQLVTREGQVYGAGGPEAPAPGAPPTAPAVAPELPAPAAEVAPPVRAAARARRKAPGAPGKPAEAPPATTPAAPPVEAPTAPAEAPPEAIARPTEAGAPAAIEAAPEDTRTDRERWVEEGEIPEAVLRGIRAKYSEGELRAGSKARFEALRAGRTEEYGGPTKAQMLAYIATRPTNIAIALHPDDAADLAAAYPPPNPKMYKMNSRNKEEAENQRLLYEKDLEKWEWLRQNPSAFEASTLLVQTEKGMAKEMQTNTLSDNYLGSYRILRTSPLAMSWKDSATKRLEFETMLAKRGEAAERLIQASETYASTGSGDFLGVKFTKNGLTFRPFSSEDMSDQAILHRLLTTAGIEAIKTADPSGRLTDKDIEVGTALINAMKNEGELKWDFIQGVVSSAIGRPIGEGEVRLAARRFFAFAAKALFESYTSTIGPHVLLGPDAEKKRKQKFKGIMRYIDDTQEIAERNTKRNKKTYGTVVDNALIKPFIATGIGGAMAIGKQTAKAAKAAKDLITGEIPISEEPSARTLQPEGE